jgi:hypothetical protein
MRYAVQKGIDSSEYVRATKIGKGKREKGRAQQQNIMARHESNLFDSVRHKCCAVHFKYKNGAQFKVIRDYKQHTQSKYS